MIDKETVSSSNLQRYVLMFQDHITHPKVDLIQKMFEAKSSGVNIQAYPFSWQAVVSALPQKHLQLVATALDTKTERVFVQSALPQKIINAWTSPDCIGVSRHFDFGNEVCLACLYLPMAKVKSESEKIAEALNMGQNEPFIRQYLANNAPIDDQFVKVVSQLGGIDFEKLSIYKQQPVRVLYSEGICGGRIMAVRNNGGVPQDMEVPLAHESAMAGILLMAEVVIESLQLRLQPIEPLTKINLMKPLHQFLREKEGKHYSGRCLCQDDVFKERHKEKWMSLSI